MHPGFRLHALDPILQQEDVPIRMVLVGILSGYGRFSTALDESGRMIRDRVFEN